MTSTFQPIGLGRYLGFINTIGVPMFLITVDDVGEFRIGGLNAAHEMRSGLKSPDIAGLAPHEFLPPRVAETVTANYRRCVQARKPVAYEEVLELASGRLWWHTTLSPVF